MSMKTQELTHKKMAKNAVPLVAIRTPHVCILLIIKAWSCHREGGGDV